MHNAEILTDTNGFNFLKWIQNLPINPKHSFHRILLRWIQV